MHEPALVRHFLALFHDPKPPLETFLRNYNTQQQFVLFHQSLLEIAFHPHLNWNAKQQCCNQLVRLVADWSAAERATVRQKLLAPLCEKLLMFAGQGQRLSDPRELSASELVIWFHDELIDALFHLDYQTIEQGTISFPLAAGGRELQSSGLHTSYLDFYRIFRWLPTSRQLRWCDVGCGMGRSLLLAAELFPQITPVGVERDKHRCNALKEAFADCSLQRLQLFSCDLQVTPEKLPKADIFFLYLPVSPMFNAVMRQLAEYRHDQPIMIVAIEAQGDVFPVLSHCFSWLNPVPSLGLVSLPRHDREIRCYTSRADESTNEPAGPSPSAEIWQRLSQAPADGAEFVVYQDHQLQSCFLASLQGATLSGLDQKLILQTKRPDKQILLSSPGPYQFVELRSLASLKEPLLQQAAHLFHHQSSCLIRRQTPTSSGWENAGHISKIQLQPVPAVDFTRLGRIPMATILGLRAGPDPDR
jgi:hypothetical protein